ncbi:hypothetical protein FXO38_29605 [Capsicum annuum]|nr:hypothetical protein FXO38_29605 [Capsicum annuum]
MDEKGHVALVFELMKRLGKTNPQLKSTVVAVFIASEENSSIPGVGVDALVKDGLLDKLKQGPLPTWSCYKSSTVNSMTTFCSLPTLVVGSMIDLILEAYEKKITPKWRYDLGRKRNFEQIREYGEPNQGDKRLHETSVPKY